MWMGFRWGGSYWILLILAAVATAHEGPEPRAHWLCKPKYLEGVRLKSQAGPDLRANIAPLAQNSGVLSCLRTDSDFEGFVAEGTWPEHLQWLPVDALTVTAWVSLDELRADGGIVSAFEDTGSLEKGWVLGYNRQSFTFGISTEKADDGDGTMTYLSAASSVEPGRWYHVVGVYDGNEQQIWVNGKLEGRSNVQGGRILYPDRGQVVVGAYRDSNEVFPMVGRLGAAHVYDLAAKPAWVEHEFGHHREWTELPAEVRSNSSSAFVIEPFLQYATKDRISVVCESVAVSDVRVVYGETTDFGSETLASSSDGLIHTARLERLKPEMGYYYRVIGKDRATGQEVASSIRSFQTASLAETPFAFAVIADTQGNPKVNGKLAQHAWGLRPNFMIVPGDLVDDGLRKEQWVKEFFESLSPLISRVPFYPVLGNHERNADHYYRYMDLPEPEYYYTFDYGNARFFMLDSNKKMDPQSEQYLWLEDQLKRLEAERQSGDRSIVWKFVSFHHPPYSSDEDDYGNLWKGKSTWGDQKARLMAELFDRYGVDVVWTGHIHSYERTWPVFAGKPDQTRGTVYMITGGGGGGLEQAGPIRPPFQNNVKRGHHFVYVAIHGNILELKAYDLEGQLFDQIEWRKKPE
jgi:hypothetical protein